MELGVLTRVHVVHARAMSASLSTRLDLKQLLSACVHLARRGGRIIREVHREGQLGAHNKTTDSDTRVAQAMDPAEVLTIADTRCQHAIVSSLRGMFPGIRLVGEEDEQNGKEAHKEELPTLLQDVPSLENFPAVPASLADSLTIGDTCLWIDPLDGTIEFVRNNVHNVCVLIGICVCDRPVAGVVLQPFVGGEDGTVTYGAVGVGVFGDRNPAYNDPPAELRVGTEPKHAGKPRIKAALERLQTAPVISQACGQNMLKVVRGEASAFIMDSGASRWDTCACEALLMAVGGRVTTLDDQPYLYLQSDESYLNAGGVIAARTDALHGRVAAAFHQEQEEQVAKKAKTDTTE